MSLIICSFQIKKFSPRSKGWGVSSVIVLIDPPSSLVYAMIIFYSSIFGWESVLVRIPSTAAAASTWMTPIVSHRFVQMLRHVFCAQLVPLFGHSLSQALFELHLWVINWVSSSSARGGCPNLSFTDGRHHTCNVSVPTHRGRVKWAPLICRRVQSWKDFNGQKWAANNSLLRAAGHCFPNVEVATILYCTLSLFATL